MPNLLHLPLESYKQRYTQYLSGWEKDAFSKRFNVTQVIPDWPAPVVNISTGSVLDSILRPQWALDQIQTLIGSSQDLGRVYLSDFYTPGLDALAYSGKKFRASSFCWAQTFDKFDFTQGMLNWMRPWEHMAFEIYDHVFVASPMLKELIVTALPHVDSKVNVVGLPFDSTFVEAQWDKSFEVDDIDCVYTSRWDLEKNPGQFLELVRMLPDLKFAVCTGWQEIRGTDRAAIDLLRKMRESGQKNLTVFTGLDKGRYYAVLAKSAVQFNCASQDWVSFTLLEALTMGCSPLYPSHRSFPEALDYAEENLYRPGDMVEASVKLNRLLDRAAFPYKDRILAFHDDSLNQIANILSV